MNSFRQTRVYPVPHPFPELGIYAGPRGTPRPKVLLSFVWSGKSPGWRNVPASNLFFRLTEQTWLAMISSTF